MNTYSNIDSIPNIWVTKQINKHLIKPFFKWYECGILGCGRNSVPWLDLSGIISLPTNRNDIIDEINNYLELSGPSPGGGSCLLPLKLNGYNFFTHYQYHNELYITKDQSDQFKDIREYDTWVINNLSRPLWQNAVIIRGWNTTDKIWMIKHTDGTWKNVITNPSISPFCLWVESMKTTLFDSIGRIMIYRNIPGHGVSIHRDYPATGGGHRAHFVNIQLTNPNRPAFIYDEITDEKIYSTSHAYMFNESDCHGVDTEDESNFTIRIDGTFKSNICDQFDLENGLVFCSKYKYSHKINNIKVIEP